MKTRSLSTVIGAFMILLTISCAKKNIDPDENDIVEKLQGIWIITGYINDSGQDVYGVMPACEKDNTITYKGAVVIVDEESLRCDVSDPKTFSSNYVLNSNGVDLITYTGDEGDDLDEMKIVYLDDTKLMLKDAISNLTISYTKQDPKILFHSFLIGKWKMTGCVTNGVDVWNLQPGTCKNGTNGSCTSSLPQCVRDDIITYTIINNYSREEGSSKCAIKDSKAVTGTHFIDNSKHQVTLFYNGTSITYDILLLNSQALIIREKGNTANDYEMYQRL